MGRSAFPYDHLADQCRALADQGRTNQQIADALQISVMSVRTLRARHHIALAFPPGRTPPRPALRDDDLLRLRRIERRLTRARSGFCQAYGCVFLGELVNGRIPAHRRRVTGQDPTTAPLCPGGGSRPRDLDDQITTTGATR